MTMTEIRYRNARTLVDECGGMAAFAEKIGKAATQASAFAGSNPRKGIGNKIARELEIIFGKPHGWMDVSHDAEREDKLATLASEISDFTPSELAELRAQIDLIKRRKRGEL